MGIVFQTSYDHYTNPAHRFNTSSGATIGSGGRNGTNGLILNADHFVAKTLPAALTTIYFASAFKIASLPGATGNRTIMQIRDTGAVHCDIRLFSDGTLRATRNGTLLGISSVSLLSGVFYHLDWKIVIDNSSGIIVLKVNEVTVLSLTSQDTQNTANNFATEIVLSAIQAGASAGLITFDDTVVRDDQHPGDVQVASFLPTGIGVTDQWTPNTGTSATATDEAAPNDDTDYISTAVVNDLTLFTYATLPASSSIDAVVPLPYAKKTDAGTAKIKSTVRSGGTNYPGAEKAPSDSSYEYHPDILMLNPATGLQFTIAEWNAIAIGPQRSA